MKLTRRHKFILSAGTLATLLLVGYIRLPMAAIANLGDYDLLAQKPTIFTDASQLEISPIQQWWIEKRMANLTNGNAVPKISVRTRWNLLLVARVRSGHYISSKGAE